ncbi:MAG: lipoate--protein ligase, partial [Ignavibacteria bacterium]
NLALEEYCVRNLDMKNDYLLFYINEPSVIIGKHQNTIEEINSGYINDHEVKVLRRISGGGAVYHDEGNLNFSFMTKHSQKSIHNFKLFTEPVIQTLQAMGVDAVLNGRNDITVNDTKISGNAQFTDTKSMFSHGTLLFNSDIDNVVKALNVRLGKIESKGIKSIKSRVGNIVDYLNQKITISDFRSQLIDSIFINYISPPVFDLNDEQWEKVYDLAESKYRSWEWNYGRSPEFNVQKVKRFSFGQIDSRIHVNEGIIREITFFGDFLGHGELKDIEDSLKNVKYEKNSIHESLKNSDLNYYFGEISIEEFSDFLLT